MHLWNRVKNIRTIKGSINVRNESLINAFQTVSSMFFLMFIYVFSCCEV